MHPSEHAKNTPDKPAYIMALSGVVVTYAELEQRSLRGAQTLRALGLKPGDHLAVYMENNQHYMALVWAAQRAGVIVTPISSHAKVPEVLYILENSDAKLLVTSARMAAPAAELRASAHRVPHFFMVDGAASGYRSWEEALAAAPATAVADECAGALMMYSSGTTGSPKGVYPKWQPGRPITSLEPGQQLIKKYFGFDLDTVFLSPAPLYHAAPLVANLVVMFQGGTSVIMERFDPEESLALLNRYAVTHSQWVPIMFIRMLKLPPEVRARYVPGTHRCAIHAAAPCPKEVKLQMIEWWGEILREYYSSTENVGMTVLDTPQWLTHQGSVGTPFGCKLHILDDDGRELPVGDVGDVFFESAAVGFEYYKEPEKTRSVTNAQGWVTIGDIGYLDGEGYLYLTDRKNFMIITGGVNVYPQEVENVLILHPRVADVAVFGVPNAEFGQEVKAVVQPRPPEGGSPEFAAELSLWCKERLSGIKCPKSIDFAVELPRLENGKLYKREIAQRYAATLV
jgi:acyl-CoA synthetase (AMP-forming)/AMP-acid ligase II